MFGLNTYRKRKMLEIDREIFEYRQTLMKEIENLALKCAEDKGNYEHEYHHSMEVLKVEIAELEARKEILENDVITYKKWVDEKQKEVDRMNALCLKMAESQKIIIQK